jgi:hypothetical protein
MKGSFLAILIILAVECADGDSARFVMEAAKRLCLEFCTEKVKQFWNVVLYSLTLFLIIVH